MTTMKICVSSSQLEESLASKSFSLKIGVLQGRHTQALHLRWRSGEKVNDQQEEELVR